MKTLGLMTSLLMGLVLGAGAAAYGQFEGTAAAAAPKGAQVHSAAVRADQQTQIVELKRQFVVPVVSEGVISSRVALALAIETRPESVGIIRLREPKLRDVFLQILFEHARRDGFDADFANPAKIDLLKRSLLDVAVKEIGADVEGVLVTSINRQDV